jgi:hypothetical protein
MISLNFYKLKILSCKKSKSSLNMDKPYFD